MSDWRHEAECLEEDPELFFPIGNTGPAVQQIEAAKAVCRRCDVVETCLQWALDTGQDAGVWGGLSEDERRSLKRRNARASRVSATPKPRSPRSITVDAGPTREVFEAVKANLGCGVDVIARVIGVGKATVQSVLAGREHVTQATETTVLAWAAKRTVNA